MPSCMSLNRPAVAVALRPETFSPAVRRPRHALLGVGCGRSSGTLGRPTRPGTRVSGCGSSRLLQVRGRLSASRLGHGFSSKSVRLPVWCGCVPPTPRDMYTLKNCDRHAARTATSAASRTPGPPYVGPSQSELSPRALARDGPATTAAEAPRRRGRSARVVHRTPPCTRP